MSLYVRPGHVFRNTFLIALRRLAVVGMKSPACKYWASSGFEVGAIMLLTKCSDCCGPRGTSHIPVFLFQAPLVIFSPFFWNEFFSFYCGGASIIT